RQLVTKGYQVALVARQTEKLDALASQLNTANTSKTVAPVARTYTHDVRDFDQVPDLLDRIRHDLGESGSELGLVVYAAGIMPAGEQGHWSFEEERAMMDTNLIGAMAWLGASAD